jgi:hypothetical protein
MVQAGPGFVVASRKPGQMFLSLDPVSLQQRSSPESTLDELLEHLQCRALFWCRRLRSSVGHGRDHIWGSFGLFQVG